MSLKTVPLEIDGIEFQTTQFPAMRALEVMVTLQKLTAGMNPNSQISASGLMTGLDGPAAKRLVMDLLECTTAVVRSPVTKLVSLDKQTNIDLIFSGKLPMMFKVIAHSIEVNFGDFNEGSEDPAPLAQTPGQ